MTPHVGHVDDGVDPGEGVIETLGGGHVDAARAGDHDGVVSCPPQSNLVMVLVAIPFAVHSPRSGRLFGVGLAIVIMAGYLVVHYVAVSFARADLLLPILAAWSANIIFLGVGVR